MELYGIEYLRTLLQNKRNRVLTRYEYYEMKDGHLDPSPAIPGIMKQMYRSTMGWCAKAVDTLADRLVFEGFKEETDKFDFNGIFNMNNPDIFASSAILSALISSCSFVYITKDEEGFPRLQVIDGANATGVINPITNLLNEGYAVLERDSFGNATREAYFTADSTIFIDANGVRTIKHEAGIPLLVPIINRPDARRLFGHSEISRACMDIQNKAANTLTRSEITAEFYSFPQKYILGMSQDAEPLDAWKATMSSMLQIDQDENGGHPVVGQFQTASMTPHIEQLRMYAAMFAGATGLTLDDIGFPSDNPSSSEAIKAAHEPLRLKARQAQRTFGTGLRNVGYVAACLRDNEPYTRNMIYEVEPMWMPIFEPDASSLSGVGDAIMKLQQSYPDYFTEDKVHKLIGI